MIVGLCLNGNVLHNQKIKSRQINSTYMYMCNIANACVFLNEIPYIVTYKSHLFTEKIILKVRGASYLHTFREVQKY